LLISKAAIGRINAIDSRLINAPPYSAIAATGVTLGQYGNKRVDKKELRHQLARQYLINFAKKKD